MQTNNLTPEEMSRLDSIIAATDDPELQSELWIFIAENPSASIGSAYSTVSDRAWATDMVYRAARTLISVSPMPHTIDFLSSLEPIERSVATMLMIGVPLEAARKYKGLSYIRYNQVVASMVSSRSWEIYVQKETELRRARRVRPKSP
jgi:hypothetical protein